MRIERPSAPLVKSKQRVADHGEVFTPGWIVEDMLDLVKAESERIDSRVLEPAFMRKSNVSRDTRSMRSTTRSLSRRFARIRAPFPDLSTSGACRCRHTSSRRRASRTLPA